MKQGTASDSDARIRGRTDIEVLRRFGEIGRPSVHPQVMADFDSALEALAAYVARLEAALGIISTTTYPATYLGMNEHGVRMYGGSQDASNYARRILDGEQVT